MVAARQHWFWSCLGNGRFRCCPSRRAPVHSSSLQGSWAGPVFGGMPSQRIFCNDTLPASQVRFAAGAGFPHLGGVWASPQLLDGRGGLRSSSPLITDPQQLPASCDPAQVRYMESFEARHSNHDLALAIAGEQAGGAVPVWWHAQLHGQACSGDYLPRCWHLLCCPESGSRGDRSIPLLALPHPTDEIGITLPSLRLDSQAKYGALSRGDASVFMRFPDASYREKIWDHCAGVIILQVRSGRGALQQLCRASVGPVLRPATHTLRKRDAARCTACVGQPPTCLPPSTFVTNHAALLHLPNLSTAGGGCGHL